MQIKDVLVLKEVIDDLNDGKIFYDRIYEGVGSYFWDSLVADIESLIIYGGTHLKTRNYYRMLARRFPYAIYYEIDNENARVVAVLPMRRDPVWVKKKLSDRK
jgi:hypothetical protein